MSTTTLAKPGTMMPDGTIYAGVSPDTGKPIYAPPQDAPLTCTFNEAGSYAASLDAHGHKDWRVPTKTELNVLFSNRAAIDGLDTSGLGPSGGWYWSSSRLNYFSLAWAQRFRSGNQGHVYKGVHASLRCVRG